MADKTRTIEQNLADMQKRAATGGGVRNQMIMAGFLENKGVLGRLGAGAAEAWRQKVTSNYADDEVQTRVSSILRFMGKNNAAEWYERLFVTGEDYLRAARKKYEKQLKDDAQKKRIEEELRKRYPDMFKDDDKDKATKATRQVANEVDRVSADVSSLTKEIRVHTGSLIRIESQLGLLQAAVLSTQSDVTDIKSLLMPKDITVKGKPIEGEWGQEDRSAVGQMRFAQYNPLAPAGMEFLKVAEKRGAGGYYTRGQVTAKPLEEGFIEDAIQKASIETAILIRKIQKKDEAKAELKRKNEYTDPKERRMFEVNPIMALMDQMNARFDKLEELISKLKGSGTGDSLIEDMTEGLFAGAAGGLLGNALRKMIPNVLRGILSGAVPFITATAVTAAMVWSIDRGMKDVADKAILNVVRDVTRKNEREGINGDLAYARYKRDMDLSLASDYNKSPERQAYIKQQWLTSKELSDEERAMALRYFNERDAALLTAPSPESVTPTPATLPKPSAPPKPRKSGLRVRGGTPMGKQTIKDIIVESANKVGVSPPLLLAVAQAESNFDPNAGADTSSAKGLFQFTNDTWGDMIEKYGMKYPELDKGPFDPTASSIAGALYVKDNSEVLRNAGIPVNGGSLYATHFLGPNGAKRLFKANDYIKADTLFPSAAKANPNIFYRNGRPVDVGDLKRILYDKVEPNVDKFTMELRRNEEAKLASVKPTQRNSGTSMDSDSRTINQSNSPAATVAALQPIVMNRVLPTQKAAPTTRLPSAGSYTSDPSILGTINRDTAHPVA